MKDAGIIVPGGFIPLALNAIAKGNEIQVAAMHWWWSWWCTGGELVGRWWVGSGLLVGEGRGRLRVAGRSRWGAGGARDGQQLGDGWALVGRMGGGGGGAGGAKVGRGRGNR